MGGENGSPVENQLGSSMWNHFPHPESHTGEPRWFSTVEPFSPPRKSYYTYWYSHLEYSMTFWVGKMVPHWGMELVLHWRTIFTTQKVILYILVLPHYSIYNDLLGGKNGSTMENRVGSSMENHVFYLHSLPYCSLVR